MKKKMNFGVLVRRRNLEELLHEIALSNQASGVSTQVAATSTISLTSLHLKVEGEESQVDAFTKSVRESALIYPI